MKLSGDAFASDHQPLDLEKTQWLAHEIAQAQNTGIQIGIVIGGGNIIRGYTATHKGLDRSVADYMGMLATCINGLALMDALESRGVTTRLMSAIAIPAVAESFIWRRALRHLEKGRVVIFTAGTGNPYFTTDSAAALRANEIKAQALLKGTKVDGLYTADPKTDPDAQFIQSISFQEALQKGFRVLDRTAISLCMENNIPIRIFHLFEEGNILKAVKGEPIGSYIGGEG